MADTLNVLRQEQKYRISFLQASYIGSRLGNVLSMDKHNCGNEGYMVRSLYFDTVDDTDFFEKESGIEYRKKIRLRVYSPSDTTVKLEMKEKRGNYQRKRSLLVPKEDALQMISCNFQFLLSYQHSLAEEFYYLLTQEVYIPRCIVQYHRIAFAAPANDTRITLDTQLQACEHSFDIFAKEPGMYPVGGYDDVTLEVKFNNFLFSYVQDLLNCCNKNPVAYSKYYMSRSISYNGV